MNLKINPMINQMMSLFSQTAIIQSVSKEVDILPMRSHMFPTKVMLLVLSVNGPHHLPIAACR